jgi:hypothetical protein
MHCPSCGEKIEIKTGYFSSEIVTKDVTAPLVPHKDSFIEKIFKPIIAQLFKDLTGAVRIVLIGLIIFGIAYGGYKGFKKWKEKGEVIYSGENLMEFNKIEVKSKRWLAKYLGDKPMPLSEEQIDAVFVVTPKDKTLKQPDIVLVKTNKENYALVKGSDNASLVQYTTTKNFEITFRPFLAGVISNNGAGGAVGVEFIRVYKVGAHIIGTTNKEVGIGLSYLLGLKFVPNTRVIGGMTYDIDEKKTGAYAGLAISF